MFFLMRTSLLSFLTYSLKRIHDLRDIRQTPVTSGREFLNQVSRPDFDAGNRLGNGRSGALYRHGVDPRSWITIFLHSFPPQPSLNHCLNVGTHVMDWRLDAFPDELRASSRHHSSSTAVLTGNPSKIIIQIVSKYLIIPP